ncbi:MAG: hypothetical protein ACYDCN_03095 [Bacteroidia bacterium]
MKKSTKIVTLSLALFSTVTSFSQNIYDGNDKIYSTIKKSTKIEGLYFVRDNNAAIYGQIVLWGTVAYKIQNPKNGDYTMGTMTKTGNNYTFYVGEGDKGMKSGEFIKEGEGWIINDGGGEKIGSIKKQGNKFVEYNTKNQTVGSVEGVPQDYALAFFFGWYLPAVDAPKGNAGIALKEIKVNVPNLDKGQCDKLLPVLVDYDKKLKELSERISASFNAAGAFKKPKIHQGGMNQWKELKQELFNQAKPILNKGNQASEFERLYANWSQVVTEWNKWQGKIVNANNKN